MFCREAKTLSKLFAASSCCRAPEVKSELVSDEFHSVFSEVLVVVDVVLVDFAPLYFEPDLLPFTMFKKKRRGEISKCTKVDHKNETKKKKKKKSMATYLTHLGFS